MAMAARLAYSACMAAGVPPDNAIRRRGANSPIRQFANSPIRQFANSPIR
jgi:hypothetical protein